MVLLSNRCLGCRDCYRLIISIKLGDVVVWGCRHRFWLGALGVRLGCVEALQNAVLSGWEFVGVDGLTSPL